MKAYTETYQNLNEVYVKLLITNYIKYFILLDDSICILHNNSKI